MLPGRHVLVVCGIAARTASSAASGTGAEFAFQATCRIAQSLWLGWFPVRPYIHLSHIFIHFVHVSIPQCPLVLVARTSANAARTLVDRPALDARTLVGRPALEVRALVGRPALEVRALVGRPVLDAPALLDRAVGETVRVFSRPVAVV